jgi:hypothetical protein
VLLSTGSHNRTPPPRRSVSNPTNSEIVSAALLDGNQLNLCGAGFRISERRSFGRAHQRAIIAYCADQHWLGWAVTTDLHRPERSLTSAFRQSK